MRARTPASLARMRQRPKPVRKLPRHRRIAIRDALVSIMREIEPTPLSAEAPCRYGLRIALIFEGWSWQQADAEAALLVLSALQYAGVKRPRWSEGQPEYTQDGHIPQTRERCIRCAKPLPEENYKYCGKICAKAAATDRARLGDQEERYAREKAYRAAWIRRQPPKICPVCDQKFQPKRADRTYCSTACAQDAIRTERRTVPTLCDAVRDDAHR